MQAIKTELLELLRRNDLLRATLLVGKVQDANFNVEIYMERLMEIAAQIWNISTAARHDPILKAKNISRVLFEDYGLIGKHEKNKNVMDDPTRYYLHTVLDKKTGSPLALTMLYSILADQVGLAHECIALPSYYIIKIRDVASDFYVDPFDGGKLLTEDDFQKRVKSALQKNRLMSASVFEKVSAYQLVARLVQQLKHIYVLKGKAPEALRAVDLLSGLFPHSPEITRDRGILYCEIEYFSKAMEDLRFYLKARPNASDVAEIKKLTSMLKGCREIMN